MLTYPYSARLDSRDIYTRVRAQFPAIPAKHALDMARHEVRVNQLSDEVDWTGEYVGDGYPFRIGTIDGIEIRVWSDEEPYDWGDIDPTDDERERLNVIGVTVHIAGEDDEINVKACDGRGRSFMIGAALWGIGYLDGTAERQALSTVLECGWLDAARTELAERAYWLARDIETES